MKDMNCTSQKLTRVSEAAQQLCENILVKPVIKRWWGNDTSYSVKCTNLQRGSFDITFLSYSTPTAKREHVELLQDCSLCLLCNISIRTTICCSTSGGFLTDCFLYGIKVKNKVQTADVSLSQLYSSLRKYQIFFDPINSVNTNMLICSLDLNLLIHNLHKWL